MAKTITKDDPTIEVFLEQKGAPFGSYRYFELAIEAGYFGCDDDETFSFRRVS